MTGAERPARSRMTIPSMGCHMQPVRPLSLVTGASSGIGAAFARQLAALGHDLVLTARRVDRLEALAGELLDKHDARVTVLPYDLADPGTPQALCGELERRDLQVDWPDNNAGYSLPGTVGGK